jgi:hypothetical protein
MHTVAHFAPKHAVAKWNCLRRGLGSQTIAEDKLMSISAETPDQVEPDRDVLLFDYWRYHYQLALEMRRDEETLVELGREVVRYRVRLETRAKSNESPVGNSEAEVATTGSSDQQDAIPSETIARETFEGKLAVIV